MTVTAPNRVLTERSAVDLARAIRRRELSAREVVEAHIAVCRRAQPRINEIVVDRYETALAEADAADARLAAASDPGELPPLLGVPCTIKEAIPLGRNARGLPLGLQAVAGPDRDHVPVAVALERAYGGSVAPPQSAAAGAAG